MYFLNINKPKGLSSFDVIRCLRKKLNVKQIGHSGTLDPLASGVLQIAVGKSCKLLDYLDSDKEYVADIKFGFVSTTFDEEGEKTFIKSPNFDKNELLKVLNSFVGKTHQIPPKYSAIKVNGKKLCDIARKNPNQEIEIKAREIEIYSIDLIECSSDFAKIKVYCKKGTYIRSLVNDIGQKLECGAYMTDLIRTKAGNFYIENSNLIDDIDFIKINPVQILTLDKKELTDEEYNKIINGNPIISCENFKTNEILLTKNNKLVSVAILLDNQIKPKKNFRED